MEAMLRLLAETSTPIDDAEKDELLHHMSGMYKVIFGGVASGLVCERLGWVSKLTSNLRPVWCSLVCGRLTNRRGKSDLLDRMVDI